MTPSQACFDLVKQFEGCRLSAYQDPGGVWTIGWGSTGPDIHAGLVWTQDQADARMEQDVARVAASLSTILGTVATSQGQFDALTDFAYNLGIGALANSTLLRLHKAGDYAGAVAQFGRWIHQGSKVLPGLVKRRAAEAALYQGD